MGGNLVSKYAAVVKSHTHSTTKAFCHTVLEVCIPPVMLRHRCTDGVRWITKLSYKRPVAATNTFKLIEFQQFGFFLQEEANKQEAICLLWVK